VTLFGADWCEDTRRALRLFRRLHVRCRYVNVDEDLPSLERALALTGGQRRTPVIDLGLGGEPIVEPSNDVLTAALVEYTMLTREEADERLGVQNVGDVERAARTGAGLALFAVAGLLPRGWRRPVRGLGAIAALTGLAGWCPGYYARGVTSIGGPGDRPDEAERERWLAAAGGGE
jgi:glutaredoxin